MNELMVWRACGAGIIVVVALGGLWAAHRQGVGRWTLLMAAVAFVLMMLAVLTW